MATILNSSFEDWNQGTLFSDPLDGQELADDWFWHKGSVVPTVTVNRAIVPAPFDGSFSLRLQNGTGGFGANTDTYAYTDLDSHTDLQGKTILVTMAVQSPLTLGGTGHIFVDDGVSPVVHSASNTIDGTWHLLTVVASISPSAPRVRIGIMADTYGNVNLNFDFATFGIVHTLDLGDGVLSDADMETSPILTPFSDSVTVNEWFSIKKSQSDPWS